MPAARRLPTVTDDEARLRRQHCEAAGAAHAGGLIAKAPKPGNDRCEVRVIARIVSAQLSAQASELHHLM
jgi:hypothetical protein